mmetsp:Transcript_1212/g.2313  ORF Transcript_1212/g.2313 Transcript_1212/m.2313 type:complete len:86 (-) Transcript_1212:72-329(-)
MSSRKFIWNIKRTANKFGCENWTQLAWWELHVYLAKPVCALLTLAARASSAMNRIVIFENELDPKLRFKTVTGVIMSRALLNKTI